MAAVPITDHDTILRWVETREGLPAAVRARRRRDLPESLRIDFPGSTGEEKIEYITWDQWFAKFEQNHLAALIQEKTNCGRTRGRIKLVSRDR